MGKLSDIADVQISLGTLSITERSFNDMLILGSHMLSTNRALVITDSDELLDMGLSATDPLYFAARDAFSQTPHIRQVYVGRRQIDEATLAVTRAAQIEYAVSLAWRDAAGAQQTAIATYVGQAGDNASDIATALASAINGTTAPVTAVAASSSVVIENDVSGAPLSVNAQGNLTLTPSASAEAVTDALAAVSSEMDNWYGLVITSRDEDDVKEAASWAEANEKLFGTCSADPNVIDSGSSTDIASDLQSKNQFRSFVMYSPQAATEYPEAALMANRFVWYAGQETWANVQLAGVTSVNYNGSQKVTATDRNVTLFDAIRNFSVTQGGRVAAGEWIDVIRLRDQLVESIKVSVAGMMVRATNSSGKVPYTDDGIQLVVNAIRDPLDLNVRRGGIAPEELDEYGNVIPSYTISAPRNSQVPTNDKANRILRDVKFTARLAGAIHVVEVRGSLVYDF